ncbi:hypothetical protein [Mangrovicoccus algicola]|uniref:Uncharacterized protein n=1 Tax=Mangrovicoccus algicola TaxID=2771008 RepID=A0A8J6YXR2_9RHOB|nr:hypothetical protein [Mangrovicoccus algicola]MBE3639667.1 hypothetical protein [Mangrovicoccus algicola]
MPGRALAGFLLGLFLGTAQAAPAPAAVAGADAPRYLAARQDWLSGRDDAAALRALSDLAVAGNAAARVLLGRIAGMPHLHSHVTAGLDRAARIALLRHPGGLSGQSWIAVAAGAGAPLAQAFAAADAPMARDDGTAEGAIRGLIAAGETRSALYNIAALLSVGAARPALDLLAEAPSVPQQPAAVIEDRARAVLALAGDPVPTPRRFGVPDAAARLQWQPLPPASQTDGAGLRAWFAPAAEVAAWQPLAAFCRGECPDAVPGCLQAGAMGMVMSGAGIFPFASPSEALIPQAEYRASPRMAADVARRLGPPERLAGLAGAGGQCLSGAVAAKRGG